MEQVIKPSYLYNNKLHYTFNECCLCLDMSESTLNRECNKRHIRYLQTKHGKVFAPEWVDEYYERLIVAPKKVLR